MKNMYGITGIQVKKIVSGYEEGIESRVNDFLEEYDGNVIDIQFLFSSLNISAFITYKAIED